MFTRLDSLFVFLAIVAGHCPDVAGDDVDKSQQGQRPALPIDDRPKSPIFDLPVLGQQPGPAPAEPKIIYVPFDSERGTGRGNVSVPTLLRFLKDSDPNLRRFRDIWRTRTTSCDSARRMRSPASAGMPVRRCRTCNERSSKAMFAPFRRSPCASEDCAR
jgi:hypothetical protein